MHYPLNYRNIKILDASQHINLAALLPVQYQLKQAA